MMYIQNSVALQIFFENLNREVRHFAKYFFNFTAVVQKFHTFQGLTL